MRLSTVPIYALLGLILFAPPQALGSVFVVDRTDDTNAAAAQVCSAAPNDCSLRGAISKANATAGTDEIQFDAGTNGIPFTLTIVNAGGLNEDSNATGDLDVTGSLIITGNGSANTIIQAGTNNTNGIDKVFAFNPICTSAQSFTITNLTIRFGRNTQPDGAADFSFTGGGLDFCGRGNTGSSLTIAGSVITENTNVNGYGGGINIDEAFPATSVVNISSTKVTNNTARQSGGGINIFGDNGNVTISGSSVSNNNTTGTGGAGAQGGGINIRITNQNDGDGAPSPFVNITNTTINSNQAVGFGGGVDIGGNQDVNISNATIRGNSLVVVAGGVTNASGGGLDDGHDPARTTTLTNVLIADNTSIANASSLGGGVSLTTGNLVILNSTISGNSAGSSGGGVYVANGPLTLTNVTISNNRANSVTLAGGSGGGISKLAGATVSLQNTLVDGNFTGVTGSTVNDVSGAVNANYSLIGNTAGATITGANNQLNVSGRLGPLADNDGQRVVPVDISLTAVLQTHALLAGSGALDKGSNGFVPGSITTDQRGAGFARFLDASDPDTIDQVDIGAYEAHPSVEHILAQAIDEDEFVMLTINYGDFDDASGGSFDSVTAVNNNPVLLPNDGSHFIFTGSGSTRTLSLIPPANLFGASTITLTVTDTVAGTLQTMTDTFLFTVNPVADLPSVTNTTTRMGIMSVTGLVVTRNPVDGPEVTHMKITNITNGTVLKNDGVTVIPNNSFITVAEANAGLKFTPTHNLSSPASAFSFAVAGATNAAGQGLGPAVTAFITVLKTTPGQVTSQ